VAGLLGIPFPNGLIPQAPFHTDSLCVTEVVADPNEDGAAKGHVTTRISHVVEQRVSNLAQGLLTLGTMSGPLLVVLHLIPQAVLAGLFFVMGMQALSSNGITLKLLFLLRDRALTPPSDPLRRIQRRPALWAFVIIQLLGFGATFAITQTIAAVGFPIIICLLVPIRTFILPRFFTPDELRILDAPTASPFTMISVGGNFGEGSEESLDADPGRSGEETAIQSTSERESDGVRVGDLAERGEGPGTGSNTHRRESWRAEGRSGMWGEGESIEMQIPGMNRRGVSRQSK
jgi:hypothetical protein